MEVKSVEKSGVSGKVIYEECAWVSPKQKYYTERFRPEQLEHASVSPSVQSTPVEENSERQHSIVSDHGDH